MKMTKRSFQRWLGLLALLVLSLVGAANGWKAAARWPASRPLYTKSDSDSETSSLDEVNEENFHTLPRLYVGPHVRLADGVRVLLTPDQAHYVTTVMRIGMKKPRDRIRVFDGFNGEWLAQVHVEKDDAPGQRRKRPRENVSITAHCTRQLRLQDTHTNNSLSEPWLFFAPIKKQRVKMMLEKCTELGVGRFVPILTERCDPSSVRDVFRDLDKLAAQTVEASEQCERLTVPLLSQTYGSTERGGDYDLSTLLKEWSSQESFQDKHLLICRERAAGCSVPLLKLLESLSRDETNIAFAVGPEGGWSPVEEQLCGEYATSCDKIHCVSLGSLVLRAETAAIAAMSACMLGRDLFSDDTEITNKS